MSNPAADPRPVHRNKLWMSQHERFLKDAKEKKPQVVLIGDSLIAYLAETEVWEQKFKPLHCLNFGIGGDRTEHVLWRIVNGELDQIQPKVIVLLVGTNNYDNTVDQVAEGILAIVKAIRDRQPASNLIVVGLLPKGERPNPYRVKNVAINKHLAEVLQNETSTHFLNLDEKEFMSGDGLITPDVMYDFLHLTPDVGYQKLCEPLLDMIHKLLAT